MVRKNLILRLTTPRFLVRGDEIPISALVHNYLTTQKTARVSLDVRGLTCFGQTQDVTIPSRGEVKVDWRFRAQQTSSATVTGKALTDEESDALEICFPSELSGREAELFKRRVDLRHGRGRRSAEFDMSFPENIEPGSRSLSIRVAPSITGTLFGALEYLTSFPYGCVEQTMSSFLPDIVVKDAVQSLGLKTQLDEASLQEKIAAGLDRLYNFQHPDGGWGWWETDDSHPFMTAYVVAGLVQARNTGTAVSRPQSIRARSGGEGNCVGLEADGRFSRLSGLRVNGGGRERIRAGFTELYEKRSNLTPYGMALLGLALENAKDRRAPEMATALEAAFIRTMRKPGGRPTATRCSTSMWTLRPRLRPS